jgi:hypothetical protein
MWLLVTGRLAGRSSASFVGHPTIGGPLPAKV